MVSTSAALVASDTPRKIVTELSLYSGKDVRIFPTLKHIEITVVCFEKGNGWRTAEMIWARPKSNEAGPDVILDTHSLYPAVEEASRRLLD